MLREIRSFTGCFTSRTVGRSDSAQNEPQCSKPSTPFIIEINVYDNDVVVQAQLLKIWGHSSCEINVYDNDVVVPAICWTVLEIPIQR